RITFSGAFHHTMNRGIKGEAIFPGNDDKIQFLEYLLENSKKMRIHIFAYCIMDNCYHLVIENSSGRMADFFKHVNGKYGMSYRRKHGGKGYVFQNRYNSTLIQDEQYLKMAIGYVLSEPVKAGIVSNFDEYDWSSAKEYFSKNTSDLVDNDFVNELFGSKKELLKFVESLADKELPVWKTIWGNILGGQEFLEEAIEKYNRREKPDSSQSIGVRRSDERYFEPVEKVFQEFEDKIGMETEEIDITTHKGKRLRGELLLLLKDLAGLKYTEIAEFPIFGNLRVDSLPQLYKYAKKRKVKEEITTKKL
ncbi:MAG: hypothetical protein GTN68_33350, partial [Candidatus Aminicenantes bacterium]|nr:hypothetical protein [Candidatus Aminicenantes bacterium]NIO85451.1 hypothetical protein [Candidatus Aminicenantes bacterium]